MAVCIITGSNGLIGSESVNFFHELGMDIVGIDNNMRSYFFGEEGSTSWIKEKQSLLKNLTHHSADIRNISELDDIFNKYKKDIKLIIHTAAQPSHDWSYKEPLTDFQVNALGTLNLLECHRKYCQEATFIFTSTNKVYGDRTNTFPLEELELRYELPTDHQYYLKGYDENLTIDQCKHSIFGASKVAADVMVQEYIQHYQINGAVIRGGCLTGPAHSSVELHGFLSYMAKCAATDKLYNIFGYKGKQVRDNIHSFDLVNAFYHIFKAPRNSETVYNLGGAREINCSVLEAKNIMEEYLGREMRTEYVDTPRVGDPKWLIGDISRFRSHYPTWDFKYSLEDIIHELLESYR